MVCLSTLFFWRCKTISDLLINEQIRDREVRLIGEDGQQLGIMSAREAYKRASEAERNRLARLAAEKAAADKQAAQA